MKILEYKLSQNKSQNKSQKYKKMGQAIYILFLPKSKI